MVRLDKVISKNIATHKLVGELTCDNISEITPSMKIEGMLDDYTLDFGSTACSASFEVAMMKSDGTWQK